MTDVSETVEGGASRAPVAGSGWTALWLLAPILLFGIIDPWLLIGVPYIGMVLVVGRSRLSGLLIAMVFALFISGSPSGAEWYLERAWALLVAGWFVAVTLRWPAASVTSRALGAVGGALLITFAVLMVRPGSWAAIDFMVTERIRASVSTTLQIIAYIRSESVLPATVAVQAYEMADLQGQLFPALVALASVAAVGVGWWLFARFGRDRRDGLGALRDFRFDDQFVWLFIAGLGMVLMGDGVGWTRAGLNALVFMGALYIARGAAVFAWFMRQLSIINTLLLALGFLFFAPVMLATALVIGLGDTWLDLRQRPAQAAS